MFTKHRLVIIITHANHHPNLEEKTPNILMPTNFYCENNGEAFLKDDRLLLFTYQNTDNLNLVLVSLL